MNWSLMIFVVSVTGLALGSDIRSKVRKYFDGDTVRIAEKIWDKYEISFENTLISALTEGFGRKGLNIYINRLPNAMEITKGYYHSDNQVQILFTNLGLMELPNVYNADISFELPSNIITLELSVGRIIMYGQYMVFRRSSDIIFEAVDQNVNKKSPFRFQQVGFIGEVAISAEGCTLSGYTVVTLSGSSVNVGHPAFQMQDCHYSIEIFDTQLDGGPPVIANYAFHKGRGITLEKLMMRPLLDELVPKLQAALFSYVNTSAIFTNNLPKIREVQRKIFEASKNFEDALDRCMNKETLQRKDMGTVKMSDFELTLEEKIDYRHQYEFALSDVLLLGLDSVYSSHMGGPVDMPTVKYAQQIRYKTLQVTGVIGKHPDDKFAVEITDLMVNVEADPLIKRRYDVMGWRNLEFSSNIPEPSPVEMFVVGYLQEEIPKHILSHLKSAYSACAHIE